MLIILAKSSLPSKKNIHRFWKLGCGYVWRERAYSLPHHVSCKPNLGAYIMINFTYKESEA